MADLSPAEAWAYLHALMAAVNVRYGLAAIHFSAVGRMDFHFLTVDDDGVGRPLGHGRKEFAQWLRRASIDLVTQINLGRLAVGRLPIADHPEGSGTIGCGVTTWQR